MEADFLKISYMATCSKMATSTMFQSNISDLYHDDFPYVLFGIV